LAVKKSLTSWSDTATFAPISWSMTFFVSSSRRIPSRMSAAVRPRFDSSCWNASSAMFFFASAYAVSSSFWGTSSFSVAAFASRISWRIRSLSRLSFPVSVSS